MKKKLFIGGILPTVAALAVIGSGFSLWIFDDSNSVSTTGSVGINVTKVLDIKNSTITVSEDCELQFDQTNTALEKINPQGTGLTWLNAQTSKFTLVDPSSSDYAVAFDSSVNYTFTTEIKLPKAVADYVKLEFNSNATGSTIACASGSWTSVTNTDDSSVTYTYTFDTKDNLTSATEQSLKAGVVMFDFTSVTASYQEGAEPTVLGTSKETANSYLKMLDAVKGQEISVSYEVKASIKAN